MSAVCAAESKSSSHAKRDHRLHGWQHLPLWRLFPHHQRDSKGSDGTDSSHEVKKGAGNERDHACLSLRWSPSATNSKSAPLYRFDLDRREFFKFLGAGVLVVSVLKQTCLVAGIRRSEAARGDSLAQRDRCLAAHWRKRQSHGVHRKGGGGTEHPHLAEPGCRRRTSSSRRRDRTGYGRHSAHALSTWVRSEAAPRQR